MAVSDLYLEKFQLWEWIHRNGSFPVYWKMFQPYDWSNIIPSSWSWDDLYVLNETSSYDCTNFQQWNEVFAWIILISNQSSSSVTCNITMYFDQYAWWWWQTPETSTYHWYNEYFRWQTTTTSSHTVWDETITTTNTTTYANWYAFWGWIDKDEIRPWITQYRLRLYADSRYLWEKTFSVSNISFNTTPRNAGYMWVEWAFLCYVPYCYYSWSSTTGYKHVIQYDTGYSWATGQTPWMIWIPDDSTDHHVYYTTSNWVVRRTKETYPRVPTSNVWSSRKWHIWMTPSTSSSPEAVPWYNYICYVDWWGYKRRLWPWDVD